LDSGGAAAAGWQSAHPGQRLASRGSRGRPGPRCRSTPPTPVARRVATGARRAGAPGRGAQEHYAPGQGAPCPCASPAAVVCPLSCARGFASACPRCDTRSGAAMTRRAPPGTAACPSSRVAQARSGLRARCTKRSCGACPGRASARATPACAGWAPFFRGVLLGGSGASPADGQQRVAVGLGPAGQSLHLPLISDVQPPG
jgi:hypothetical protein